MRKTVLALTLLASVFFLSTIPAYACEGDYVVTNADNSRHSATLLADDETLHLGLDGGNVYEIDVTLFVEQGAGDIRVALSGNDGLSWTAVHGTVTTNMDGIAETTNLANFDDVISVNGPSGLVTITYHLVGKTDDTGTLAVQWSQRVNSFEDTTVLRGSIMRVRYL